MEYQMRNWYYFVWLSGDLNVEQHVHMLDLANWVKGDQYPVEANGMGGREVRKGKDYGQIFDHHFVEYTYADGTKLFSQSRHIRGCWSAGGVDVHGRDGTASWGKKIEGPRPWSYEGPNVEGHQQEHIDLLKFIRDDTPHNEGYYGATSSMTAVLGRMATYSGQVVKWDEAVAPRPRRDARGVRLERPAPRPAGRRRRPRKVRRCARSLQTVLSLAVSRGAEPDGLVREGGADRTCSVGGPKEQRLTPVADGSIVPCVILPGGRWIAGSSQSIVSDIPHENFLAMITAWHKYGRY